MTDNLTWAEFTDKYKPKDGDKFTDDRGNIWLWNRPLNKFEFSNDLWINPITTAGNKLTCPLIPPKQKRKLWPALCCNSFGYWVTDKVFPDEKQARYLLGTNDFVLWPAVPNADGSYEVPE